MLQSKRCGHCKERIHYRNEDTIWDYSGYTPVKLVECPNCGKFLAVKYLFESNPNEDLRYYTYAEKNNREKEN